MLLKLLNLSYHYANGNSSGIESVSLEVQQGELYLLVGRTGAGKTTLLRLISRELAPNAGEIILKSHRSSELKRSQLPVWRKCMGIVYQDFKLLKDRSAYDNVMLAAFCELDIPSKPKDRTLRALGQVGLSHKLHLKPDELSTGEQQRVAIARALVNEPLILLADEPVSNLDGQTSDEVVEVLQRVSRSGTAMLIATHQPERFDKLHPRIICMDKGKIISQ